MSEILYSKAARDKVLLGVNAAANAVKISIGPMGKNAFITNPFRKQADGTISGGIASTRDGISIARSITLKDPMEEIGASLVKQCSAKTVLECGDFTSGTAILLQSIITQGVAKIESGATARDLIEGINLGCQAVVKRIKELSQPVTTTDQLRQIATISANNDAEIGGMIAEVTELVGVEGLVMVEQSPTYKTTIKKTDGTMIARGLVSDKFINNKPKHQCEFENPLILLYEQPINQYQDLGTALDRIAADGAFGRPVVIIAPDFEPEVLSFLATNVERAKAKLCAIQSPGRGQITNQIMEDLAVLTGATFASQEIGLQLKKMELSHMGTCEKIIITKNSTVFVGSAGAKEAIEARCAELRTLLNEEDHEQTKELLRERIAALQGGIAILSVGGVTDIEMQEKMDRIDDSLKACRAAQAEGYLPGGGTGFIRCQSTLTQLKAATLSADKLAGIEIVEAAIREPFNQILTNAGADPDAIYKKVSKEKFGYGYNARTGTLEDLLESGVIDPAKSLRVGLENAVSIGTLFLLTEVVISNG